MGKRPAKAGATKEPLQDQREKARIHKMVEQAIDSAMKDVMQDRSGQPKIDRLLERLEGESLQVRAWAFSFAAAEAARADAKVRKYRNEWSVNADLTRSRGGLAGDIYRPLLR